jgi:nucleoid-associated protein EbfC
VKLHRQLRCAHTPRLRGGWVSHLIFQIRRDIHPPLKAEYGRHQLCIDHKLHLPFPEPCTLRYNPIVQYQGDTSMGMDMNSIMRQAQKLQEKMAKAQEELASERIEHSVSGGMVKCTVSGSGEVLAISISEEALAEGHEMLEDLVLVAVREALAKSHDLQQKRLGNLTGGMNIPGLNF